MSSLYQENISSGSETSWQRAYQVMINNPRFGAPTVMYVEQKAYSLADGSTFEKDVGSCVHKITDPTQTITFVDPMTGQPMTLAIATIMAAISKDYVNTASARDEAAGG